MAAQLTECAAVAPLLVNILMSRWKMRLSSGGPSISTGSMPETRKLGIKLFIRAAHQLQQQLSSNIASFVSLESYREPDEGD